jgi:hypothetical protein
MPSTRGAQRSHREPQPSHASRVWPLTHAASNGVPDGAVAVQLLEDVFLLRRCSWRRGDACFCSAQAIGSDIPRARFSSPTTLERHRGIGRISQSSS